MEVSAEVVSAVNQLANVSKADLAEMSTGPNGELQVTLSISTAVEEGDSGFEFGNVEEQSSPSNSTAVEEETTEEESDDDTSPSNSTAVEEGKCGATCNDGSPCQIEAPCHVHNSTAVDGKEQENDDESSSKSNSTAVDEEELLEAGVKEDHLDKCLELRKENGECAEEECRYGANEDSDYCASHSKSGSNSNDDDSSGSNSNAVDEESTADRVQKVKELLNTDIQTAKEAVEAKKNGMVSTESEYLKMQS
jgi:hypothetical protein